MATGKDEFILHIEGELTKRHTIPVDMLVDIAVNLQNLIQQLALNDIPSDEPIDAGNFKIELAKFTGGSATPSFVFTENINQASIGAIAVQRQKVHEKFNHIMSYANSGDYLKLREDYREPVRRNAIVGAVYSFVESFKNAPVEILDQNHKSQFRIKKFKKSVRDLMITEVKQSNVSSEKEKNYQMGKVLVTRDKKKGGVIYQKKLVELFDQRVGADYSTDTIVSGGTVYELNYSIHCSVDLVDGMTQIENDMLGIFGSGQTLDEAEKSFAVEFDYIYNRYNELPDKKLTKDVISIKKLLNLFVKKVSK